MNLYLKDSWVATTSVIAIVLIETKPEGEDIFLSLFSKTQVGLQNGQIKISYLRPSLCKYSPMAATPDGKLSWFGCKSLIVTGFIQYIVVKLIMVANKNLEITIWSPMEVKPTVVNDNRIVPNILED